MTEPATTVTEADTAVAPSREWNPTTDTMIDIGTAVLAGLRAYPTLPPIISLHINTELKPAVTLCPGGPYTVTAVRNLAVWAQALDLGLTLTNNNLPDVSTEPVTIGGHPVQLRVTLYSSRRDELVDLLVATCPDMPPVPQAWKRLHPTPAQVITALAGHPHIPDPTP